MAKARGGTTLADQLRDAIGDSGLTNYALGERAAVPEATIWRFRKGERDVTLETAGRLAEALGLELVATRRKARAAKAPRRSDGPEDAGPAPVG